MKYVLLSTLITALILPTFVAAENVTVFLEVDTDTGTTTPPTPSTPGNSGGSSEDPLTVTLTRVVSDDETIEFRWETNKQARATIDWGRTPDYELGSISRSAFIESYSQKLKNLLPDTRYYIRLTSETRTGERVVTRFEARTLARDQVIEDDREPVNPVQFEGEREGNDVILEWKMLEQMPVRIVRSDLFYPGDPFDGEVVFEGEGSMFIDENVPNDSLYYTIFSKNERDEYSSGVVLFIGPRDGAAAPIPEIELEPGALDTDITLSDLTFVQNNKRLGVVSDEMVAIDASLPLTVLLDSSLLPKSLKSIVVTIRNPHDEESAFRFLLRINKEHTAYVATLAPIGAVGRSSISVDIMNYANRSQTRIQGILDIFATDPTLLVSASSESEEGNAYRFLTLLLIAILAYTIFKLKRLKRAPVPIPVQNVPAPFGGPTAKSSDLTTH